jgi:hypothetical protein
VDENPYKAPGEEGDRPPRRRFVLSLGHRIEWLLIILLLASAAFFLLLSTGISP